MHQPSLTPGALGAVLRTLRQEKRLTQQQLAEASGVSPHYISEIERAERNPSWTVVAQLAAALGLPLSEFFAEAEARVPGSRKAHAAE